MRLIDADEAKKLERMFTLKPSERALFRLMLDRIPTYEPPNDPLTLEELREMDGEVVYITPMKGWAKIAKYGLLYFGTADCSLWKEISETYGDAWLAYRRRPEEGGGMKGIPMKDWEVRAILEGRKTVTRRVVKEPYYIDDEEASRASGLAIHRGTNITDGIPYPWQPYRSGDILYVKETFSGSASGIVYKADEPDFDGWGWHPSIHMPREAARIFLRVTGARVERLQDITEEQAEAEGVDNYPFTAKGEFYDLWNSTLKPADRALYGWDANPYVWVIEFERCEKAEGETPYQSILGR